MLCFTYFRVMPEFIEFLSSFGYQSHAQDPFFCCFRQRTCLSVSLPAPEIPDLAWSGAEIQLCYNLKSAERSSRSDSHSWSIRDCAVHHTLDVKNVRANWIVIKGNDVVKDRVEQATQGRGHGGMLPFATVDRGFAASLAVHLLLCGWAGGQWRWYINSLEKQFQSISRGTLTAPVTLPQTPMAPKDGFRMPDTRKSNASIVATISRIPTVLTEKFSNANGTPKSPTQRTYIDPDSGLSQPLPPHIIMSSSPVSASNPPQPTLESAEEQDFSFAKSPKIQYIQEKTQEALLVLRMNSCIIRQLKVYYGTTVRSNNFPQEVVKRCQDDLEQFELRLTEIYDDLQMQILRLETLARLLADRKTLVCLIII